MQGPGRGWGNGATLLPFQCQEPALQQLLPAQLLRTRSDCGPKIKIAKSPCCSRFTFACIWKSSICWTPLLAGHAWLMGRLTLAGTSILPGDSRTLIFASWGKGQVWPIVGG